jgi:hypothetical protein
MQESNFKPLSISKTGIRSGEYLTSMPGHQQNKGTIMQVKIEGSEIVYPPSKIWVSELSLVEKRDSLPLLDFFANKTEKESLIWLEEHATDHPDLYLSDIQGVEVRFTEISGKDMLRIPEKQRSKLLEGEYVFLSDVYPLLNKPGSRKNLIFRPSNWTVMPSQHDKQFNGILITLTDVDVKYKKYKGSLDHSIAIIDNIAVEIIPSSKEASDKFYQGILNKYDDSKKASDLLHWASPSIHKSLIQKIIRTRTPASNFLTIDLNTIDVLVTSFIMLFRHPGVLNTQITPPLFETGIQSATKRLGVSVAEDSSLNNDDVLFLFASGLYSKIFKNWKPSEGFVLKCINLALDAYKSPYCYVYEVVNDPVPPIKLDALVLSYYLLSSTGTLSNDVPMLGWIAENKGKLRPLVNLPGVEVPLVHCIDQHNLTDIAWHVPYDLVKGRPYVNFLGKVWDESSSANSRKSKLINNNSQFMKYLRLAQYEVWLLKCFNKAPRKLLKSTQIISYTLHESWIAGLFGVHIIKLEKKTVYAVLNANNVFEVVLIPKLARGEKEYQLTDKQKEWGTEVIYNLLEKGINVQVPSSLKSLHDELKLTMKNDTYYVNNIEWADFAEHKYKVSICETLEKTTTNACIYTGNCIEENYIEKIQEELENLSSACKSRLLSYIAGVSSKIQMRRMNRMGEPLTYQVAPEDTEIYHFFCAIAIIAPVAMEPKGSSFYINNGPICWHILDYIKEKLTATSLIANNNWKWKSPNMSGKELYQHQETAFQRCIESPNGKNIINMTPGLGKTRIVIHYLDYLIKHKQCKYCIYSLPHSAKEGVINQFKEYKIDINILSMTKGKTANYDIKPWCVNFVFHDHMRKYTFLDQVREILNELFFVMDEFHLAMSDGTQRTSIALEIASTAKYSISMTGTMINNNIELMIPWMKLVSRFEVTKENLWVAIGGVASYRITTNVIVRRKEIHFNLTPEEKILHNKSFKDACEVCYDVVNEGIITTALDYINRGIGVFIVSKDAIAQKYITEQLNKNGVANIYMITSKNPIDYKPDSKQKYDAIITTSRQTTGYTVTGVHIMITSVYFSNQAAREQLDARLNRLGQPSKYVDILTLHCGILSYVLERYNKIRTVAEALKGFAEAIQMDLS